MTGDQRDQPMSVRATAARWTLGAVPAVGALVLLLKPGGVSKLLALVLAAAAVTTFARRSRSDATIVTVVLLVVAAVYLGAFLSGNSHWITDRY
ncbi:hypothetical protein LP422_04350 [Janibacter limosus]|uniref:Uncharacterized protein n=1 Tax=Janibacter limosus TaxID=53458 RepID=A0AC61U606_9MICO|nr:hypothetical protein [Janibacter limosus]UUZ45403.1 hypothetical protein LP422_04350 [Janibacter limosus]